VPPVNIDKFGFTHHFNQSSLTSSVGPSSRNTSQVSVFWVRDCGERPATGHRLDIASRHVPFPNDRRSHTMTNVSSFSATCPWPPAQRRRVYSTSGERPMFFLRGQITVVPAVRMIAFAACAPCGMVFFRSSFRLVLIICGARLQSYRNHR
jgi:hypothetical protein